MSSISCPLTLIALNQVISIICLLLIHSFVPICRNSRCSSLLVKYFGKSSRLDNADTPTIPHSMSTAADQTVVPAPAIIVTTDSREMAAGSESQHTGTPPAVPKTVDTRDPTPAGEASLVSEPARTADPTAWMMRCAILKPPADQIERPKAIKTEDFRTVRMVLEKPESRVIVAGKNRSGKEVHWARKWNRSLFSCSESSSWDSKSGREPFR